MATKTVRRRYGPKPLAAAVERGQNAVDGLVAGLGADVGAALRSLGDRPLTAQDWAPLMVAVDRALAKVYGPSRGANSALADTVDGGARRAVRGVASDMVAAVEPIIARRDPELLARIRAGAGVKE